MAFTHLLVLAQGDGTLHNKTTFTDLFDDNSINPFWTTYTTEGTVTETGGKLQMVRPAPDASAWAGPQVIITDYRMVGDFDVSVTIDMTGMTSNIDGPQALLQIYDGSYTFTMGGQKLSGSNYVNAWTNDPSAVGTYYTANTGAFLDAMKYRIVRSGSTITSYYDNGGGWTSHSTGTATSTGPARIALQAYTDASGSTVDHTATFDEFYSSGLWQDV